MPTYIVKTNWSGYSRGVTEWEIEAEDEEEAREMYHEGNLLGRTVVRDDTEDEVYKVDIQGEE